MKFSKIIKQVAKQNGVTPMEVEREIKEAIRIGMTSQDPLVQAQWKLISPSGEEPTVDEFLTYLMGNLKTDKFTS